MKVELDTAKCTGHAQCHAFGPDFYGLDDRGYCVLTDAQVPPGLEEQARLGAEVCPEAALTVFED